MLISTAENIKKNKESDRIWTESASIASIRDTEYSDIQKSSERINNQVRDLGSEKNKKTRIISNNIKKFNSSKFNKMNTY